jgi:hypothetical protein
LSSGNHAAHPHFVACCPSTVAAASVCADMGNAFVSTDFIAFVTGSDKISSGYLNLSVVLSPNAAQ